MKGQANEAEPLYLPDDARLLLRLSVRTEGSWDGLEAIDMGPVADLAFGLGGPSARIIAFQKALAYIAALPSHQEPPRS